MFLHAKLILSDSGYYIAFKILIPFYNVMLVILFFIISVYLYCNLKQLVVYFNFQTYPPLALCTVLLFFSRTTVSPPVNLLLSLPKNPSLPTTRSSSYFLSLLKPTQSHLFFLSHTLFLPLRTVVLSTLHTVSAMQHALQDVTGGGGLGLQKEVPLSFLCALSLLI